MPRTTINTTKVLKKKEKILARKLEGINIIHTLRSKWASPVAQLVKNPPAMWETWV